ncbi:hypothetical protein MLD38_040474 [Melastoma candidum]|nr:hypothetical protein MLD38_040474 [Melastoma candidum]
MANQRGGTVAVPVQVLVLVLSLLGATIFVFFLLFSLSSPSSCSCATGHSVNDAAGEGGAGRLKVPVRATKDDADWVRDQIRMNGLHMQDNVLRKGFNPRTRQQQLQDLIQFKGISHYKDPEVNNHTALPCPGELLVEEHHSNYRDPWAGGRDVFEFLAEAISLEPNSLVLEIGCGTLRVGLHFISYLNAGHYHCLERDELSLMAAFSTVFLHMPDKLVWTGLERLAGKLKHGDGCIFVSHNIKFCSRLGGEECTRRFSSLGVEYVGVEGTGMMGVAESVAVGGMEKVQIGMCIMISPCQVM